MPPDQRRSDLGTRLLTLLTELGQASAPELSQRLGISQPTFSRLVRALGDALLVTGSARARRYAARRNIEDVGDRLPVYAVDERARARRLAWIHAVEPEAFYVEALTDALDSRWYRDLPFFIDDLRPSGFLGRLVPRQHPELGGPSDVRLWSASLVLRYLARFGWNSSGNLIVGDDAFERYVAAAAAAPDGVQAEHRSRRYVELARDVLSATPGSSAGGEQPKFLVTKLPAGIPLLVKFSPPVDDASATRHADLLRAEHHAHSVLLRHGRSAARSALFEAGGRVFLEVERFDRTPGGGRRGLLSLLALDAKFVGRLRNWTDSVRALIDARVLARGMLDDVRYLELFGRLIGNTDMHAANLSFFVEGSRVLGLAPAYDMLPAFYAGPEGHRIERELDLGVPTPADASVWDEASRAASEFWREVTKDSRISAGFRRIATRNEKQVLSWRKAGALLPKT